MFERLKMRHLVVFVCLIGFAISGPSLSKSRDEIEKFRDALENSRTEDGYRLESRMLANPQASAWENSGKFQGDIILDDEQIQELVADYANNNTRAAYIVHDRRWPGAVVPFDFQANNFNAQQQELIQTSIRWIEHFSCVRFRRRRTERDFVLVTGRNTGCYARVGYARNVGVHTHNLAPRGCLHNIIIIHEFLHNLGFFHMQSAYERYNFVRINWENIANGKAHNFYRLRRNQVNLLNLPYEYQSCMHYSTHAFSTNGRPTIVATRNFNGVMGHMRYVTHYDWVRLRRHYNCPERRSGNEIEDIQTEVERTKHLIEKGLPPPPTPYDDIPQESFEDLFGDSNDINVAENPDVNDNEINVDEDVGNNNNDVNVVEEADNINNDINVVEEAENNEQM